jgi:DNA-directed RNA polymerase specialized sigma24 family protein
MWQRYFPRLLTLARYHLDRRIRARYDEEDLLQSVGKSIFRRLERGDFDLAGRDDLWALLVTITLNKACNAADYQFAEKRRPDREQRLLSPDGSWSGTLPGGSAPTDGGPTPAEAAELAEQLEHRLRSLETEDDPDLRSVAEMKLEGYTNREIADRLRVGPRTVERKLALIRKRWTPDPAHRSGEPTTDPNTAASKLVEAD